MKAQKILKLKIFKLLKSLFKIKICNLIMLYYFNVVEKKLNILKKVKILKVKLTVLYVFVTRSLIKMI